MTNWKSHNGGQAWAIDCDGRIQVKGLPGHPRTNGEPRSMQLAHEAYKLEFNEAAARFEIPVEWLMGLMGVESGRMKVAPRKGLKAKRTLYFNPYAKLWEDDTRARPDGEFSGGLLQVLESTASSQNKKHQLIEGGRELKLEDLLIPRISVLVGASYFKDQLDRYDGDPILAQAAYNAGSVRDRPTRTHPWGFVTHNPHRALYYAQWVNDAVEVLEARA